MTLHFTSGTNTAANASAYQVTGGEWDPTTIQWTNKPAANVLLESNISNNDRTKYQFSVLTAVRHWYDGDPTGQNENYGIMLRYYDETLTGYYNSVYSGDNDMTLTDETVSQTNTSRLIADYSLSNSLLYIYDACLTASNTDGTGKNLCTATIAAGADCVIGWTEEIDSYDAYLWQQQFQSKLIDGYTVVGAANEANLVIYPNDNEAIKSWRIYGNKNLIITPAVIGGTVSDENYVDVASSMYSGIKYSDSTAIQMIQSYFADVELADTDSYTTSKIYTSDDEDNYVVDFVVYRGQYSLNVGYSILVENGAIIGIRNNMTSYSASGLSTCVSMVADMEEVREKAYEEAASKLHQMSADYSVVSQTDDLYYDCTTATRYCKVFTVYETENGGVGAFTTHYPIDGGFSYEE